MIIEKSISKKDGRVFYNLVINKKFIRDSKSGEYILINLREDFDVSVGEGKTKPIKEIINL